MKYLILALALMPFAVSAESYYDPTSGNSYRSSPSGYGDTTIYGSNLRTGRNWSTNIRKNGDMNGLDGNTNPWTYNSDTGFYYNYGTGTMCNGTGALRMCY